jgi:hypothetical protein
MSVPSVLPHRSLELLDQAIEALAGRVRRVVSNLRCTIEHGANGVYPWWLVVRFINGEDESKVIDISLECKDSGELRADIAREGGYVLGELTMASPSTAANGHAIGLTEGEVGRFRDFLGKHEERIVQELKA